MDMMDTTIKPEVQRADASPLSTTATPVFQKALRSMQAVSLTSDEVFDALQRLCELETENTRLREVVQHWAAQAGETGVPPAVAAAGSVPWRHCEFCHCKTNAKERICCQAGRDADRQTWDRSALAS
jgi:hypothetical protein